MEELDRSVQEEEIVRNAMSRLIPNKHDLMVMAVFALVVGIVFWAGWESNPTLTCKIWLSNQIHEYYLNESINFCNGTTNFSNTVWNPNS